MLRFKSQSSAECDKSSSSVFFSQSEPKKNSQSSHQALPPVTSNSLPDQGDLLMASNLIFSPKRVMKRKKLEANTEVAKPQKDGACDSGEHLSKRGLFSLDAFASFFGLTVAMEDKDTSSEEDLSIADSCTNYTPFSSS